MNDPSTNTDPLATRDRNSLPHPDSNRISLPSAGRDQTSTGDPKSPERSAVVGREASGEGGSGDETLIAPNSRTPQFTRRGEPSGSGHLEVRCPNCHAPTSVATDSALTELVCSSCGSNFSLVDHTAASRQAPPLAHMGRFELIARVGMGAFGSVWKARDKQLDRTVAIKIPCQSAMTAAEQEKFFREARTAAQLRHPNIVSVHEVGRDGDSLYIVSDFVHGVTLGDWLTGQQLTSREAAELCAKIAAALHHAHEQGVIHRDLKPANIMIDAAGEPHLMDFGLARREVGELTVTTDGQVLGTPAYMSPEQAQGESHTADRRSDVYSLGVVLFQLLTNDLPFRGNARMVLHQVINEEAPSPRKLNGNIAKDLETITQKCLSKEPANRYHTAHELAVELSRFLSGEPILARPVGRVAHIWRWMRKHQLESALLTLIAASLLSLVAILAMKNAAIRSEILDKDRAIREVRAAERDFNKAAGRELKYKQEIARLKIEQISQLYLFYEECAQNLEYYAEKQAQNTTILASSYWRDAWFTRMSQLGCYAPNNNYLLWRNSPDLDDSIKNSDPKIAAYMGLRTKVRKAFERWIATVKATEDPAQLDDLCRELLEYFDVYSTFDDSGNFDDSGKHKSLDDTEFLAWRGGAKAWLGNWDDALANLRSALDRGLFEDRKQIVWLDQSPLFETVRNHADFQVLLKDARASADNPSKSYLEPPIAQLRKHDGNEQIVEFNVRYVSDGEKKYLFSMTDRRHPDCFTVVILPPADISKIGIGNIVSELPGKPIRVTGELYEPDGRIRIFVSDTAKQLMILDSLDQ